MAPACVRYARMRPMTRSSPQSSVWHRLQAAPGLAPSGATRLPRWTEGVTQFMWYEALALLTFSTACDPALGLLRMLPLCVLLLVLPTLALRFPPRSGKPMRFALLLLLNSVGLCLLYPALWIALFSAAPPQGSMMDVFLQSPPGTLVSRVLDAWLPLSLALRVPLVLYFLIARWPGRGGLRVSLRWRHAVAAVGLLWALVEMGCVGSGLLRLQGGPHLLVYILYSGVTLVLPAGLLLLRPERSSPGACLVALMVTGLSTASLFRLLIALRGPRDAGLVVVSALLFVLVRAALTGALVSAFRDGRSAHPAA